MGPRAGRRSGLSDRRLFFGLVLLFLCAILCTTMAVVEAERSSHVQNYLIDMPRERSPAVRLCDVQGVEIDPAARGVR
jgi:hypothetical protein